MLLFDVINSLESEKLRYAIVGGYALALHGLVRATMDVDIVLSLNIKDFQSAESCLNKIGLQSRIPVGAKEVISMREEFIKNRNLIAWSFVDYKDPSRVVDILITRDIKTLKLEKISVAGRKINVCSLEDLIEMKLEANRPQDQLDIVNIRKRILELKNGQKK